MEQVYTQGELSNLYHKYSERARNFAAGTFVSAFLVSPIFAYATKIEPMNERVKAAYSLRQELGKEVKLSEITPEVMARRDDLVSKLEEFLKTGVQGEIADYEAKETKRRHTYNGLLMGYLVLGLGISVAARFKANKYEDLLKKQ